MLWILLFDAEPAGRVGLGVQIDEQDFLAAFGKTGGKVDRGGRLADSALLVRERNDRCAHEWPIE